MDYSASIEDIKKRIDSFSSLEHLEDRRPEVQSYISARDHDAEVKKMEQAFVDNLFQRFMKRPKYNIEI